LGAGFSVADAYLFVMLMWARKNGLSLPVPLPAYFERMKARPRQPFATHTQGLASPVSTDAPAGQLTRGSFKTIPASEETTNTQRFEEDSWLPFLDTYRTMCLAPQPDFRRVLEDVRAMQLAA
jgi:hypothetical protein